MQDSELGQMAEPEGGTLACPNHSEKAHLAVGKAGGHLCDHLMRG